MRNPNLDEMDPDQYKRVKAFFAEFAADKEHPGLPQSFQTTEEFANRLREDLVKLLYRYNEEVLKKSLSPSMSANRAPAVDTALLQRRYLQKLQIDCNLLPIAAIAETSDPHANLRLTLDKVYIGLNTTLKVDQDGKIVHHEAMAEQTETRALTALQAAAREHMLVILGDPGSGKSSFINHLLWQLAEIRLRPKDEILADWPHRRRLPVRMVLRELLGTLQKENAAPFLALKIPGERQREFSRLVHLHLQETLAKDGLADFAEPLRDAIAEGECLIVFDGLDEAATEQRELLRHTIEYFCAGAPDNRFIVTCRILSYDGNTKLPSFNNVTLAPFDNEQVNAFIAQWYKALQGLGKPADWTQHKIADLQQAAAGNNLPEGMVRNPLLLTTLASIHANNAELPRERVRLYKNASDLLLLRWQETKSKKVSLFEEIGLRETTKMNHALWELGHFGQQACYQQGQKAMVDIPRKEALAILERNFAGLPNALSAAGRFLDYVDETAGLLNGRGGAESGERVYAFPHRTFQEYFAGCYLAKRTRDFEREVKRLLPEGDFWRLAAQLGIEELLHNDHNEIPAQRVISFLCPLLEPKSEADWRGVLWAGHFALAIGAASVVKYAQEGGDENFLARLQQRLVTILEKGLLPARERADAGFVLGKLGDTRPGVCDFDPPMWVSLPGGKFKMGDEKGNNDEKPVHEVELSPFKISKYPITNAQFAAFMNDGGYKEEKWWSEEGWKYRQQYKWEEPRWWKDENYNLPNQPVVGVSWFEAEAFCNWLTAQRAKGEERGATGERRIVRLPTEAEWEFAARGAEGRKYPWGNDEPTVERANYKDSQLNHTTAVGSYPLGATLEGVLDLAGNVWEWCIDWYGEKYYAECKKKGVAKNPRGSQKGDFRVERGGAYYSDAEALRGARRFRDFPFDWYVYDGFRVCVVGES